MTVRDIVTEWLAANGYDGLVSGDTECGCKLNDLVPCDSPFDTCEPAYRGPDPTGEAEWLMYRSKEAAAAAKTP